MGKERAGGREGGEEELVADLGTGAGRGGRGGWSLGRAGEMVRVM